MLEHVGKVFGEARARQDERRDGWSRPSARRRDRRAPARSRRHLRRSVPRSMTRPVRYARPGRSGGSATGAGAEDGADRDRRRHHRFLRDDDRAVREHRADGRETAVARSSWRHPAATAGLNQPTVLDASGQTSLRHVAHLVRRHRVDRRPAASDRSPARPRSRSSRADAPGSSRCRSRTPGARAAGASPARLPARRSPILAASMAASAACSSVCERYAVGRRERKRVEERMRRSARSRRRQPTRGRARRARCRAAPFAAAAGPGNSTRGSVPSRRSGPRRARASGRSRHPSRPARGRRA